MDIKEFLVNNGYTIKCVAKDYIVFNVLYLPRTETDTTMIFQTRHAGEINKEQQNQILEAVTKAKNKIQNMRGNNGTI